MKKSLIDWPFFLVAFLSLLILCSVVFFFPNVTHTWLEQMHVQLTDMTGVLYLWIGFSSLIFLIWAAFSKHGQIRLGKKDESPEFSTFSWISMIFCAGIGSGIMYWGAIEWGYYYLEPPLGLIPGTPFAVEWSAAYGLFHYGPTAWAIYCLPALPIAYLYHVKKVPILKISEACRPVLNHHTDGFVGKLIDMFFMIGLLGASGTTLGISIPLMAEGVKRLTGIQHTYFLDIFLLLICTIVFAVSVFAGMEKGVKRLSNINVYLVFFLLLFVTILGPTFFILEISTNSVGLVLNNFFRLNTWMDPIAQSGFPEKWTIFYWAWWIVYAPFIGLFIAKISRGRTIKEMILGTIIFGPVGCWLFFFVLGNYGLYLQNTTQLDVAAMIKQGHSNEAVISIIHSLPLGDLILVLFLLLSVIFVATTYDTSSYMLAAVTQREIEGEPIQWNRLFWAFSLALPPMALLIIGGLTSLQAVTLLVAIPSCIIMVLLSLSFLKLV
ncbi:BCCT family betaine/carnitine transporter [Thalassobacillus devorans]|nr:BCCT family transporter [Thalassobacillus devorans]NIK30212.1 BCCT family betaine/carnitine transporter [Thalassobacillus devorans]